MPPTGIKNLYCVYGTGVSTVESITFLKSAIPFGSSTSDTFGPGDGFVNARSLELCKMWPGVKLTELPGVSHVDMLRDQRFFSVVNKMLQTAHSSRSMPSIFSLAASFPSLNFAKFLLVTAHRVSGRFLEMENVLPIASYKTCERFLITCN
ncbi:hypothetical protein Ciccas_009032 [Cichlidogyrus casuarinus]|uniref:Uncharacterized protein n=1 Tax=Cichlidogyrus casuarinus TaxID=1844966 RepID=A0ABD2PZ63_9PLAT